MAGGRMLQALQNLFRAHPEGLTLDEIVERYRIPKTRSVLDPETSTLVTETADVPVGARHKRPKHVKSYLERAIERGMMRKEPSPQGFRYHAAESFFSLVEDRSGQLVDAHDPANAASREEQARARREELKARARWERVERLHAAKKEARARWLARLFAPSRKTVEALRRRWEAEQSAQAAEHLAREAAARCLANTARLVRGCVECPFCGKIFPAQGDCLGDSFGDRHAVIDGLSFILNRQGDNSWRLCEPEGCGGTFHLPKRLSAREEGDPWQDGVCPCGSRELK